MPREPAGRRPRARRAEMRVLLVDNASSRDVLGMLRGWADGTTPWKPAADIPFEPRSPRGPVAIEVRDLKAEGRRPTLGTLAEDVVGFLQAGGNDGFAAGVNRGLETFRDMPEMEYFWILDSDAMTEPDTPATLVAAAKAAEAEAGGSS